MTKKCKKDEMPSGITSQEASSDRALIEQQRKDLLAERERIRKWVEDDVPLPVKMSCKISQHIVAKTGRDGRM